VRLLTEVFLDILFPLSSAVLAIDTDLVLSFPGNTITAFGDDDDDVLMKNDESEVYSCLAANTEDLVATLA
jgi:hypothetical protein